MHGEAGRRQLLGQIRNLFFKYLTSEALEREERTQASKGSWVMKKQTLSVQKQELE